MTFKWTATSDNTLALEGHEIQVKLLPEKDDWNFAVFVRGHRRSGHQTLKSATNDGERIAKEFAQFQA